MDRNDACEMLHAYWNGLRAARPFALRADFNPASLSPILPCLIMLDAQDGHPRFRLAGTRVCAFFRRELKDRPFADIWRAQSAEAAANAASRVLKTAAPLMMTVVTDTQGLLPIKASLLLLPLSSNGRQADRLIGVFHGIQGAHIDETGVPPLLTLHSAGGLIASAPPAKVRQ